MRHERTFAPCTARRRTRTRFALGGFLLSGLFAIAACENTAEVLRANDAGVQDSGADSGGAPATGGAPGSSGGGGAGMSAGGGAGVGAGGGGAGGGGGARAVPLSQVPDDVLRAADAAVPGFVPDEAEMETDEQGVTEYTLKGTANGVRREIEIDVGPDGTILEVDV